MKAEKFYHHDTKDLVEELVIALDINGMIIHTNGAWVDFCRSQKYEKSHWAIGTYFFDALKNCGKEKDIKSIELVMEQKTKEGQMIFPFIEKSGAIQWLKGKIRRLAFTNGQTRGVLITYKLVRLGSPRLITAENVLESMTDGFMLLDDNMQIIFMNEIAESMLECKREGIVLENHKSWFPSAEDSLFYQYCVKTLQEQQVQEFIDFYPPLNVWLQVKVCPLKNGGLALYFRDVSERKKKEMQIAESIYYDYTTGLPNRGLLTQIADSLISQKKKFSIFHIAIDNFNFINAFHHYNTAETIMKKYADELKIFSSITSHVGRLEGNEFIVLRESQGKENLALVAEQLENIFYQPVTLKSKQKMSISVSIGIACYPFNADTSDELFSSAEVAMHEAKTFPGSHHSFFRPRMKASYKRKSIIEQDLSKDLDQVGLYYTLQPQIHGETGELNGAEVLARWEHPELGSISPLEFIQIAEESGQIATLTSHLLIQVFTQIKEWEIKFDRQFRTAINMTPSLLSNPVFFDHFLDLMEQYQVPPTLLEIEITEQVELTYSPRTLENLLLCKAKGITISIDDFGTGFSMISYLTHFPINKIKIDRSFVQKIGQDQKSEAVLKSLIYLAKSIECDVVAEGVERRAEVEFLQDNGCEVFQGYLYDKPLKPECFEAKYLKTSTSSKVPKEVGSSSYN